MCRIGPGKTVNPEGVIYRGLLLHHERKGAIILPPMKKIPFKNPFLQPKAAEKDRGRPNSYRGAFAGGFPRLDGSSARKPFRKAFQQHGCFLDL
ncbi:MAG: hypothetical protein ACLPN1_14220 [Dissulfurispiraceae bacterium]